MPARRDISVSLFVLLLGTYAYFWPHRGWNEAARLMLTYAIVDRGTIAIDGLESHSGDISLVDGHYYSCKAPGQSLLGVPVYAALKPFGVAHPTNVPRIRYWWPDYVLNIATSGVPTAFVGVLLYWLALQLGCSHGSAAAVGLCYGLATPALPYAALYAGHQAAAACAFGSLAIIIRCAPVRRTSESVQQCADPPGPHTDWKIRATSASPAPLWPAPWMALAGFLAGYAVVTEYPLVFTSAALLVYAILSGCPWRGVVAFLIPAGLCAAGLAWYHTAAFGGPFETGYAHLVEPQFHSVYTPENPIGVTLPTLERAWKILFSGHGLVWYAPATLLAPLGLVSLVGLDRAPSMRVAGHTNPKRKRGDIRHWTCILSLARRAGEIPARAKLAVVVAVAFGSLFLVNAAHPTWTGGWSTGPRYLISGLPLLFVPIAALLAGGRRLWKWLFGAAMAAGFVFCLASTACTYSGRLPDIDTPGGEYPLVEAVLPDVVAGRFGRSVGNVTLYGAWEGPPTGNWWCLVPLLVCWEVVVLRLLIVLSQRRRPATRWTDGEQ